MTAPFRLLQITDCHLTNQPGGPYRGIDPDAGLESLNRSIQAFRPDALVLTGDLSEDGSPASYRRIRDWLLAKGLPASWIPGNHDDRSVMEPVLQDAGFIPGPLVEWGQWQGILLDSARPGHAEGYLDDARLETLDRADTNRPAMVCVHHQPLDVGAEWIDKVGLVDKQRFRKRLAGLPNLKLVAFGHVHQRFRVDQPGMTWLAGPASSINSLPATDSFEPAPDGPLARWFRLWENGDWLSGILGCQEITG